MFVIVLLQCLYLRHVHQFKDKVYIDVVPRDRLKVKVTLGNDEHKFTKFFSHTQICHVEQLTIRKIHL